MCAHIYYVGNKEVDWAVASLTLQTEADVDSNLHIRYVRAIVAIVDSSILRIVAIGCVNLYHHRMLLWCLAIWMDI